MAGFLLDETVVAFHDVTGGDASLPPYRTTVKPRQDGPTGINHSYSGIAPFGEQLTNSNAGEFDENWGYSVTGVVGGSHYEDFWLRLWVIPPVLQLTNPQLYADIPFRLWNTWTSPQALTSILVSGSSVLSFDLLPTDVINDSQYLETNLQIGPGEPTIDATVSFTYPDIEGTLRVIAAVSSTFNLIPDVPVTERWNFLTDIITAYDGSEQRASLRRYPRLDQEFNVEIINERQRREQYNLLRKNITVQALVPMYQYATPITGTTPIGGTKIYFDPIRCNVRVGQFLAVVNTTDERSSLGVISSIEADGAILNSASGEEISGTSWVVIPAINCTIEDGSGIRMDSVSGVLSVKAKSFTDPSLVRPGATRAPTLLNGIPLLDRRPLISAEEQMEFEREIIDNQTGVRDLNSSHIHPRVVGNRSFVVQRVSDPEEMDYWRSLFDTVRGAQGTFLLSTYFPDLTLESTQTIPDGASQFIVNEGEFVGLFQQYGSWEHIELAYGPDQHDGQNLRTQHQITSATLNTDGTATVGISPAIPLGPDYEGQINRISFLVRCRASDTIAWQHFANYSVVNFGITSVDK